MTSLAIYCQRQRPSLQITNQCVNMDRNRVALLNSTCDGHCKFTIIANCFAGREAEEVVVMMVTMNFTHLLGNR